MVKMDSLLNYEVLFTGNVVWKCSYLQDIMSADFICFVLSKQMFIQSVL
jgi:hypothetical protein